MDSAFLIVLGIFVIAALAWAFVAKHPVSDAPKSKKQMTLRKNSRPRSDKNFKYLQRRKRICLNIGFWLSRRRGKSVNTYDYLSPSETNGLKKHIRRTYGVTIELGRYATCESVSYRVNEKIEERRTA